MPSVSIIVPIYNVERYLSFCLDSLRAQTLTNIEIICVNDGSTDKSLQIARAHATLDERIRIINKDNGGLSSARNAGIDVARGEYILFVDSDDFLERKACEKVTAAFSEYNADVVTFGANCVPAITHNPWLDRVLSPRDGVFNGFSEQLLFDESSHPFAWRTALRSGFVKQNDIRFVESLPFGEDQVFHFEIYPLATTTVLLSDKLYDYRTSRKDSLMHTFAMGEQRVPKHIEIVDAILQQWNQRNLMHLCPERLMDWILDFLCFDLFALPKEEQITSMKRLGNVLKHHFTDPITIATNTFPTLGEVVTVAVDFAEGKRDEIPSRTIRHYTRYRIGIAEMARQRLHKVLHHKNDKLTQSQITDLAENAIERAQREQELTTSLQLLALETAFHGQSIPRMSNKEA